MRQIKKSTADQSVVIRIVDATDGTPELTVDYDTTGIDLWYRREGATKTSISEVALAALNSAHLDGGIEPIGAGYYRLDLPDAAVLTGSNGVLVGGAVTGMVVIGCYVHLVDFDPQDTVWLGLTALPNADADAAGGLPISDAGALDLDAKLNADNIAAAFLDLSNSIETGWTVRKVLRIVASAICGKVSGAATTTNTFRSITDAKARVTATVDIDGNRSAVTLDGT